MTTACFRCKGSGQKFGGACFRCQGTGKEAKRQRFSADETIEEILGGDQDQFEPRRFNQAAPAAAGDPLPSRHPRQ